MTWWFVMSHKKPICVIRQQAASADSSWANQPLAMMWWMCWPEARASQTLTSSKQIFDFGIRQVERARMLGGNERQSNPVPLFDLLVRHLMLHRAQHEYLQAHTAQGRCRLHLAE